MRMALPISIRLEAVRWLLCALSAGKARGLKVSICL